MAFVQTLGGTEQVMIAGSCTDDVATVRGTGFNVSVASGIFTITFDRAYDAMISFVCTIENAGYLVANGLVPIITAKSLTDGTSGGSVTVSIIDPAGNIQSSLESDMELNFIAVMNIDT